MSDELKIQIPDGYRWVKAGEVVSELYEQAEGRWVRSARGSTQINWHYITPIESPKPEFEDAGIGTSGGYLGFVNPNDDRWCKLYEAPSINGVDWVFAGFVWEGDDRPRHDYYNKQDEDSPVEYAKAVRFRRVQGGAK